MFSEHTIIPWIAKTGKMLGFFVNKTLHDHGIDLTREQFLLLKCLMDIDGKPQQDLALITESDKTSLSRLIATMEKKELIFREKDVKDKRIKKVFITDLGKKLYATTTPLLKKTFETYQEGISQTEILQTIETIKKLQLNLNKEHQFKL